MLRVCCSFATAGTIAAVLVLRTSAAPAAHGVHVAASRMATPQVGVTAEPLFSQTERTTSRPPSPLDKHTLRRGSLTVSQRALAAGVVLNGDAIVMHLFPDVQIAALRYRVESRPGGDYSWFGRITGDPGGRVIITVVGGQLAAVVTPLGKRYVVMPAGDGTHDVREIDVRSFPETDDTTVEGVGKPGGGDPIDGTDRVAVGTPLDLGGLIRLFPTSFALTDGRVPEMRFVVDDGTSVDIMIVYSHRAECVLRFITPCSQFNSPHDDPQQIPVLAQMAVDIANQTFEDSDVETHLNVIGSISEVHDFQESGSDAQDFITIRDGHVAGVHDQRNDRAADMVVLITWQPGFCGRMPILGNGAGEADAYAVINILCMIGNYTLAHELGHGFGGGHDWETTDEEPPALLDPEAHGFISRKPGVTRALRTIMSYNQPCQESGHQCEQVGYWSDPNRTIEGYVLGIAVDASNRPAHDQRTLNKNADVVANHRLSVCRYWDSC
jgi:hypothetical protein